MGRARSLACVAVLAAILTPIDGARARTPLALARAVDIARMKGGWYIVATIPNSFERGMVQPYDVYSDGPAGSLREDFYVRRGRLDAPRKHFVVKDFVGAGDHARWGVQIFWPLRLPFLLLYVDPAYRYALFGEENRKLGWIYARSADMPDADYAALLARFAAQGYDTARFRRIVHHADQIGQPGFWSDGISTAP